MTPSEAFAACVKVCGEGVYPPGFLSQENFKWNLENHPDTRAIALGIVHLQGWIAKKTRWHITLCDSQVRCFWCDDWQLESHDSTPASIFIALCKLAERIGA